MWPFIIISLIVVVADRIVKSAVSNNFDIGTSVPLIKGILHITPTYNKGVAFGLFKEGAPIILIAASVITIFLILYAVRIKRPQPALLKSGLFLVLGGACGNIIDRILYGHVFDFIDIRVWPVFNIADSSITIGACLILFYLLSGVSGRKNS